MSSKQFQVGEQLPLQDECLNAMAGVTSAGVVTKLTVNGSGELVVTTGGGSATTEQASLEGSLGFASALTTYVKVLESADNDMTQIFFKNGYDKDVIISLDAGTTGPIYLDAGGTYVLDLAANGKHCSTDIHIKTVTAVPTSGTFYCGAIY